MNDGLDIGLITGAVIGLFLGILIAFLVHVDWKKDSVKQGKAEYYLDESHNKQWRWK